MFRACRHRCRLNQISWMWWNGVRTDDAIIFVEARVWILFADLCRVNVWFLYSPPHCWCCLHSQDHMFGAIHHPKRKNAHHHHHRLQCWTCMYRYIDEDSPQVCVRHILCVCGKKFSALSIRSNESSLTVCVKPDTTPTINNRVLKAIDSPGKLNDYRAVVLSTKGVLWWNLFFRLPSTFPSLSLSVSLFLFRLSNL